MFTTVSCILPYHVYSTHVYYTIMFTTLSRLLSRWASTIARPMFRGAEATCASRDEDGETATHCNTLQHTATHCSTLHYTATHCNILHYTATHYLTLQHIPCFAAQRLRALVAMRMVRLQHTATHCNTLQHTATHCNTLQHFPSFAAQRLLHTAAHSNTLQHFVTRCNTLQATHCNALQNMNTFMCIHVQASVPLIYGQPFF